MVGAVAACGTASRAACRLTDGSGARWSKPRRIGGGKSGGEVRYDRGLPMKKLLVAIAAASLLCVFSAQTVQSQPQLLLSWTGAGIMGMCFGHLVVSWTSSPVFTSITHNTPFSGSLFWTFRLVNAIWVPSGDQAG